MDLKNVRSIDVGFIELLKDNKVVKEIFDWSKEKDVFVGIREKALCFYYKYAKLFELKKSYKEIMMNINKSDYYTDINDNRFKDLIDLIKNGDFSLNINSLSDRIIVFLDFIYEVCGSYNDETEKMYQQMMLTSNNMNSNRIFIIDLEIKFKGKNVADTGRPDMLGYDFQNNSILLIEVKNKSGAYSGKSGIVQHLNKYYEVISDKNNTMAGLKGIVFNCIKTYKELELMPNWTNKYEVDESKINSAKGIIVFYLENYEQDKYYKTIKKESNRLTVPSDLEFFKIYNIKDISSFKFEDYLKEKCIIADEVN